MCTAFVLWWWALSSKIIHQHPVRRLFQGNSRFSLWTRFGRCMWPTINNITTIYDFTFLILSNWLDNLAIVSTLVCLIQQFSYPLKKTISPCKSGLKDTYILYYLNSFVFMMTSLQYLLPQHACLYGAASARTFDVRTLHWMLWSPSN